MKIYDIISLCVAILAGLDMLFIALNSTTKPKNSSKLYSIILIITSLLLIIGWTVKLCFNFRFFIIPLILCYTLLFVDRLISFLELLKRNKKDECCSSIIETTCESVECRFETYDLLE